MHDRRLVRLVTVLVLIALLVSLGVWLAVFLFFDLPVDFAVYYMAGHIMAGGASPYLVSQAAWQRLAVELHIRHYTQPYRYPPYTAVIGRLLGPLGPQGALIAWEVAGALGFVAGAWLVGLALGGGWKVVLALGATLVFGPVYHTLMDGQVNGLAFLGLAVGFWGLSRRRELAAGGGAAVAAALKLTPLALFPYFFWRRRWRAGVASLAGLVLLTLLALPLAGWRSFADYAAHAVALTDPSRINLSGLNQSTTAALGRIILGGSVVHSPGSITLVHVLAAAVTVALAGVTAAVTWPRRGQLADEAAATVVDAAGYGMVVAATLVVGSFTYYHQFSWLLIPLVLVADRLIEARRWILLGCLVVLVLAVNLNQVIWLLGPSAIVSTGLWRALSAPFVLAIVLWGGCGALAVAAERRTAGRVLAVPAAPGASPTGV